MMNIMHFYEAGKSRSGTALIPFFDTLRVLFAVSTRFGNLKLDYNDGAGGNFTTVKNRDYTDGNVINVTINHNYASEFAGDVRITALQGLRDVYSIAFSIFQDPNNLKTDKLNIQDFGIFIKQFPNLYSYHLNFYAYQTNARKAVIKGDLAAVPDSVERIRIENFEVLNAMAGDAYFNFSSLGANSKLKYFLFDGTYVYSPFAQSNIKFLGNLANLPVSCSFFKAVKATSNSVITYTAGKVWASSFDTLSIPVPLSHTENNSMLADMDGSVSTSTGGKVIENPGYRTGASDAYVSSLNAKGFIVNIPKYTITPQKILDLDFQNNLTDSTGLNTMVAGGTSNQPTFALSGRKAGEYCAVFNGSQSIKTTANLPINSDKATVVFAMKTNQSTTAAIFELSPDWVVANSFVLDISSSKLIIGEQVNSSTRNVRTSSDNINDNTWKHITVVFDRANPTATKITLYINGALAGTTATTNGSTTGNFVNNIAFVGQRAGSSLGFNGSLMRLKAYNYPLTPAEVTADYNDFL